MTESHRSPTTVLFNTVLPGLGAALVLGAPILLALLVAAVVSVAVAAILASPTRARAAH
jgi:hypothetical protein